MIVNLFTFKTQYTSLIIGPFICSFISTSNYVHLNEPSWSHLKLRIILLHMLTRSERLITIRIKYYIGCHYERGLYHCLYKNILIGKYIIHTVLDTFLWSQWSLLGIVAWLLILLKSLLPPLVNITDWLRKDQSHIWRNGLPLIWNCYR